MKKIKQVIMLLISGLSLAQIGVNTAIPKATMDVSAKRDNSGNILDNSQTLGLQAPRVTRAELTANTATYNDNQKGALIYITDITGGDSTGQRINIIAIGYYYFDGTVWLSLKGETTTPNYNDGISRIALAVVNNSNTGAAAANTARDFAYPTVAKIDNNLLIKSTNTTFTVVKAGYYNFSFYGALLSGQNQGGTGQVRITLTRNSVSSNPGNTSVGYGNGSANMYLGLNIVLLLEAGDSLNLEGQYTRAITIGPSNLGVIYLGE